ncbi:NAD-dependent epimerase [Saccharobesus litoralis]|uniref:NAD-dependent epimerase n=1 Tax=Saccharobesus litoralis TaxID=2172099 RepID=A0A2S0VN94_9ALTE|nr:NAD-dependent epimerase/dehydratase family protein [Saccharobesus litoralis]AWB65701.1 NAD-dependent epimerase [Saccharobesus litoralis]
MKVLVTGASGFVGLNIVKALQQAGHDTHVYLRASSKRDFLQAFSPTFHTGELTDLAALQQAMQGVDAVIHTAGNTSCFKRDYQHLFKVNVTGTQTVIDAALASGVKRLVYTSTTSTIGAQRNSQNQANEATRLQGFRAKSPYAKTKLLAEQAVLAAQKQGLEVVILNPAEIIGEFDHNFQWGRLVMAVFANQVPFLPPGAASFCCAAEVGKAHVNALTQGKSGERYILAGDDRDYRSFLQLIADSLQTKFDLPNTNYSRLYWREKLKEWLYPLLGRDALVEPYRIRVFGGQYYFSSAKAEQDLGYQPIKLEQMIGNCVAWYRANGILPPAQSE